MTKLGFISIRNEDGTQWLSEMGFGPRDLRIAYGREKFEELEAQVPDSKKNDCPDNGYRGLWNLTWHECTQEEADAAAALAARCEEEMDRYVEYMDGLIAEEEEAARQEAYHCPPPNEHG